MEESVRAAALSSVEQRYPRAELVVVAGSSATVRRKRSDIDLLVIGPPEMFSGERTEAAHTDLVRGELFEVFASTEATFRQHAHAGLARFRPVSSQMLVDGVIVLDRGRHDALIEWTRELVAAGPHPSAAELAQRRYSATSTLDDLLDAALVAGDSPELERLTLAALAPHGGRLMEGHVRGDPARPPT